LFRDRACFESRTRCPKAGRAYATSSARLLKAERVRRAKKQAHTTCAAAFSPTDGPRKTPRSLAFSRLRCIAATSLNAQAKDIPPAPGGIGEGTGNEKFVASRAPEWRSR